MSTKNLKIGKILIIGVIPSFPFQRAKHYAIELHKYLPQRYPLPEIRGMLEFDWNEKLIEWKRTFGREFWCIRRPVVVFFDDRFVGSDVDLIRVTSFGNTLFMNIPRRNMCLVQKEMKDDYCAFLKKSKRIFCYLDICIDDIFIGTLTFLLYSDILPKTCENFKSLCLGNKGKLFSYKESRIHRVVKGGWLQGGDIQYKTGGGGYSIYCRPLEDENYAISHDKRGILSMVNNGKHKNGSQFLVTFGPALWLDRYFVAFGRLIEGVSVLEAIENAETFFECPLKKIEIKNCGKLILEDDEDVDEVYEEYLSETDEQFLEKPKKIEKITDQITRLLMEAVTAALAAKEHVPDVTHEGDVSSSMNLQLYFQGLYSIPHEVLEESAGYLRSVRRELFRYLKSNATEVVETIMHDLLMAVLTKSTTLDDIKETLGRPLYQKMIEGIDMEIETIEKTQIQKFVDQLITTSDKIIKAIGRKLNFMRRSSKQFQKFQNQLQNWVKCYVLQEGFLVDLVKESKPLRKDSCPAPKKRMKKAIDEICDIGDDREKTKEMINMTTKDFFSQCKYEIKRGKRKKSQIRELFEPYREKLRILRGGEKFKKPITDECLEKKVKSWMREVVFIPETIWIRDAVFDKEDVIPNHIEEIMCGALTVGLLEMYYLYEEYSKRERKKLLSRKKKEESMVHEIQVNVERTTLEIENPCTQEVIIRTEPESESIPCPPCKCGDSVCDCKCDPNPPLPPPPPSVDEKADEEPVQEAEEVPKVPVEEEISSPRSPGMEPIDMSAITEDEDLQPEEIRYKSFRWLKNYILEKGCDTKSRFAKQVHIWLNGEKTFSYSGFLSKHSLATRASLSSLSFGLANLITENNDFKTEIRNFIYDLWVLYYEELVKEAVLQNSATKTEVEVEEKKEEELGESRLEPCEQFPKQVWSHSEMIKYCPPELETKAGKESKKEIPEEAVETEIEGEDEIRFEEATVPNSEEERFRPYTPPSWIKFLTEMTKQALALMSKSSRLPRRLYFTTDSELSFDDKMKEWFDFNSFNSKEPSNRDITDYIWCHRVTPQNLESTVRSFSKKKVYSGLIERSTRHSSANDLANGLIIDVIGNVMKRVETPTGDAETVVSEVIAAVIKSTDETVKNKRNPTKSKR